MDLWIRSQDRCELRKVEGVVMAQEGKFFAIYPVKKDLGELEILGHYKSEERAIEVLDEIQKLLIGDVLVSKNFNTPNDECLKSVGINNAAAYHSFTDDSQQVEFLHRDCVIYKMPER